MSENIQQDDYRPVELSPDVAALCTSVEHDLLSVDTVFSRTQDLRSVVTDKLFASVITMDLDFKDNTDAEEYEAKMGAISALSKLLADQEKSAATRVGLKMKKRDQETNHQIGVNVVQLVEDLRNIGTTPQFQNLLQTSDQQRDDFVQKLYETTGQEIIKEELLETSDVTALAEEVTEALSAAIESDL